MRPRFENDVPLAPRCTLGVGGPAKYYAKVDDPAELAAAARWAKMRSLPTLVLGGGSNLVVADAGVQGLVIELGLRGVEYQEHARGVDVLAAAGEPWDEFVASTLARGLVGLERLSGIPGRVGASPIQNVGAYGQEVSDTITQVSALDLETGDTHRFSAAECRFAYRTSFFKSEAPGRFAITQVHFRLRRSSHAPRSARYPELEARLDQRGVGEPTLHELRAAVLELRREKSMLSEAGDPNRRSCGSFFVNPELSHEAFERLVELPGTSGMPRFPQPDGRVKLSAAWLIEHAGLQRGTRDGPVGLSTRHALAVVAHDGARAEDVLRFARRVRGAVLEHFGVELVPEPVFWGFGEPFVTAERVDSARQARTPE